jgi:hypothetical protein
MTLRSLQTELKSHGEKEVSVMLLSVGLLTNRDLNVTHKSKLA